MKYIMAIMISSLVTATLTTLIEPPQVEILSGVSYDFSIDYCTISIPPYISTMNAHCYCFYNPITEISYNCSVPGPTFIFYAGDKVSITWHNRMIGDSISNSSYFNKQKDLDITNLYTHGLHISPNQGGYLLLKILPGNSHTYNYNIPADHYPGTHWLHASHHGSASFQVSSGLFSSLLIKYSDDMQLGDDSLINMKENVLLFHWYYIITTSLCNCSNTAEWKTYFYYPPKFDVSDCIAGKECFQVFSLCYKYCSMPETQRLLSGYTYNIQSNYNNNFQLFVVNGQFEPSIDIKINTFHRLRFINAITQYYIQYRLPISHCEWYIIAIDGIFLYNNEVRSINSAPYFGEYLLPSGGRLDVIVKCDMLGIYNIRTSENTDIDSDLYNIGRAPAGYTLFRIAINEDGDDVVTDVPTSYPLRPNYLTDLSGKEINICGCNTYNDNNNNTDIITWNETECGFVFNMKNNHNINGIVFNPNTPSTSLEYGKVYEFTLIPHMHTYHQRTFPFQMQTDIGVNGFQAQAGDWYDTIGGPKNKQFKFRTYPIDFSGAQIIHCHQLTHQDMGMMTYIDILQPHQTCNASSGEIIGNPTKKPTPRPTRYQSITSQPTSTPTKTPTIKPTKNPTKKPTKNPTKKPTKNPTKKPTKNPTKKPTKNPTKRPTYSPTDNPAPNPTLSPTKQPTNPTHQPTGSPTLRPTRKPTRSPLRDICPIVPGIQMDFIVLFDNSCGLSEAVCNDLLEFVGEVISIVLDDTNQTRVQTMATRRIGAPDIIVVFGNTNLQNDPVRYVQTVRQFGECTDGGNGNTDLLHALHDSLMYLDVFDNRIDKIIIISACLDNRDAICDDMTDHLAFHNIDSYIINFRNLSNAINVITSAQADTYLKCVADYDENRVCSGELGHDDDEIIDNCLLPHVCNVPTQTPTLDPSILPTTGPTTNPSKKPSISPSKRPTNYPTTNPSKQPSISPSKPPTNDPTQHPTQLPTNNPTQHPTQVPTNRPTPEPTLRPSKSPISLPSESPTTKPTGNCFVGEVCQDTSDCCMHGSEAERGITCSCYTKMSETLQDYFCCILKGYSGCKNDNDCCRVRTACYQGVCVDKNHPTTSPTMLPTKPPTYQTISPTKYPTATPTLKPTYQPSGVPTYSPSNVPTFNTYHPTSTPTSNPSLNPSKQPTTNEPTLGPTQIQIQIHECFVGQPCTDTQDCCVGEYDIEGIKGITCSSYNKLSTGWDDPFCCILKGYSGCVNDNDCCRIRTLCFGGVCVDKNNPIIVPTNEPTKYPSIQPTSGPTEQKITEAPTATDGGTCFIGSNCLQTEDCCSGYIDERLIGITCSGYTKMNENTDDRFCCIQKNYEGCKKDEDCCRIHSECFWGLCVNSHE